MPLEESATTEASRRCPLTEMLRDFGGYFLEHVLEAFANGICIETAQNAAPAELEISQILSVCLSDVCLSVFFLIHFLVRSMRYSSTYRIKITQKRALARFTACKRAIFWSVLIQVVRGRCTLLKWRLRRHLPPRVNSSRGSIWGDDTERSANLIRIELPST